MGEYRIGNKLTKEKIKKEHRGNLLVRRIIFNNLSKCVDG